MQVANGAASNYRCRTPDPNTQVTHAGSRQGRRTLPGRQAAGGAGILPQGLAPARLGHEEPARAHLQSAVRPHRHAGDRPRLFPGPDHRARAHRPVDRAAAAVLRRAVLHPRHPALGDPGGIAEADGAARQRRPEHPARGTLRRADRHGHGRRGATERRRRRHPGVHRRRARDPLGAQHDAGWSTPGCAPASR